MPNYDHQPRFEHSNKLIDKKATGTPKELARKLNSSKRTVYSLIKTMKESGASIAIAATIGTST